MSRYFDDVIARGSEIRKMNAELQRDYRRARAQRSTAASVKAQAKMRAKDPEGFAKSQRKASEARRLRRNASRDGVPAEVLAEADRIAREWLRAPTFECSYCHEEIAKRSRTIDHSLALAKGGKHTPENLRRACKSCNSRKGTQEEFYA